jgi:hypothetical protein
VGKSVTGSFVDMKDSIFSVPDVLMKDLDEAHAAAKLVRMDNIDHPDSGESTPYSTWRADHCSSASSVVSMEEEDFSLPPMENGSLLIKIDDMNEAVLFIPNSSSSSDPRKSSEKSSQTRTEEKPKNNSESSDLNAAIAGATAEKEVTSSMSRTSNKKRRKKLKMLKKAQAAASAALKIAEKNQEIVALTSSGSSNQSIEVFQNKGGPKIKSRSSKKIANIAVACATESMAAYREELILRGIK